MSRKLRHSTIKRKKNPANFFRLKNAENRREREARAPAWRKLLFLRQFFAKLALILRKIGAKLAQIRERCLVSACQFISANFAKIGASEASGMLGVRNIFILFTNFWQFLR